MGYTVWWEQLPFSDYTYSNVIKLVPKVISSTFTQEDWGFTVRGSEDDVSCVERHPTQMTFSKTNRMPYTKDFMKALILMVEFGAAKDLDHDDPSMALYVLALDEVHAIHPLVSYDQQKAYFITVETLAGVDGGV